MSDGGMLETALRYAQRGWAIFPLHSIDANKCCTCGKVDCPDAGKHPRSRRGLKEASKDLDQVRAWFGPGAPASNIGLVCGAISGITCIDIDTGPNKSGAETWAALIEGNGEPVTLTSQTGSGGLHLLFKYNSILKTSSNTLGKNIDCRNDNGYIVAPPSIHRSGNTYKWLDENEAIADLPAFLARKKETRGRPRRDDPLRAKYTIEQTAAMLEKVPADDRDTWRMVGIVLGREFDRSEAAWALYQEWSAKWKGKEGRNHNQIMHECFYDLSQQPAEKELSMGTIVRLAIDNGWAPKFGEVPVDNFIFYGPGNNFIYRPTASFWIAEAVNAACSPINEGGKIIKPGDWLRQHALTTSMTNDPGLDGDFIKGIDCRDGIIVQQEGAAIFNSYRGPTIELGDARLAGPFLAHVRKVFPKPGDADQFLNYMAHRVQYPGVKPRFALLIAGDQGVGKDTAVEFCCPALGPWNISNIDPGDMESSFNEFASAVLVRVNEAANLQEMSKWAFNEKMKVLIAGTPDHVHINPKYGQKYSVRLHCGVILTTNHMLSGIYIPQDDRRYDVIEAASKAEMGIETDEKAKEYFSELWDWFIDGGAAHVAAYLNERDISEFSASNGQRKTMAHLQVSSVGLESDSPYLDELAAAGNPPLIRGDRISGPVARGGVRTAQEIARQLTPALARAGYAPVLNPERKDGRWEILDEDRKGKLVRVYGQRGEKHGDHTQLRNSVRELKGPLF